MIGYFSCLLLAGKPPAPRTKKLIWLLNAPNESGYRKTGCRPIFPEGAQSERNYTPGQRCSAHKEASSSRTSERSDTLCQCVFLPDKAICIQIGDVRGQTMSDRRRQRLGQQRRKMRFKHPSGDTLVGAKRVNDILRQRSQLRSFAVRPVSVRRRISIGRRNTLACCRRR